MHGSDSAAICSNGTRVEESEYSLKRPKDEVNLKQKNEAGQGLAGGSTGIHQKGRRDEEP